MKQELFVIATRGRGGKEIYLAIDESRESGDPYKVYFKWTENIEEAMATFGPSELESCAKNHFKNYTKWYIRSYNAVFN